MLSASDIETYRACPLRYKFARVLRVPQEPTINQRFGILVHQVLERYHQPGDGPALDLLSMLDGAWPRHGFGDSDEERQLRAKATLACAATSSASPTSPCSRSGSSAPSRFGWARTRCAGASTASTGCPAAAYELIDYKTGRPRSAAALKEDVQLSLYAVGAREAWQLDASEQSYLYVLDDQKVRVPSDEIDAGWIADTVDEVGAGILAQDFEPTPSHAACSMCDFRIACPASER